MLKNSNGTDICGVRNPVFCEYAIFSENASFSTVLLSGNCSEAYIFQGFAMNLNDSPNISVKLWTDLALFSSFLLITISSRSNFSIRFS